MGFNKGSGFGSGGGGGGGGVVETYNNSGDNRVLTSVNSTTINGETNLTFNGSTNVLSVTGQVTASVGLSGSSGQFGSLIVGGSAYASGLFTDATAFTASTRNVLAHAGTTIDADTLGGQNSAHHLNLANATGELSLDRLPATLTASVLSGTTALSGAVGRFGTVQLGGADLTATATELNQLDGLTLGSMAAANTSDYAALAGATFTGVVAGTQFTGSAGLSGALGQFGSVFVQGQSIVGHYATGSDVDSKQPLDATLTALAGVSVSANKLIYATDADTFTTTDFSVFGRSLVDDANASAARTTLGLGTMAVSASSDYAALAGATFAGDVNGTNFSGSGQLQLEGDITVKDRSFFVDADQGKVGIRTAAPQYPLDILDMGGLVLSYTRVTGSIDGTGKEVLWLAPNKDWRVTAGWSVKHENNTSQLKLTFTMPASGRAEISVPSGIGALGTHASMDWFPSNTELTDASTASGYSVGTPALRTKLSQIVFSLSTTSGSYTPAGPRNEFEQLLFHGENNNLRNHVRYYPGPWVMTGSAGSSHTVYLAYCFDSTESSSNYSACLIYGGTGSTDSNAPSFGPIVMKAVSLPALT